MNKLKWLPFVLLYLGFLTTVTRGQFTRQEMDVPMVDPSTITLDGQMNEAAWSTAATGNLVSSTGYNFWINYYGREGLSEPEYDEYSVKLLWAMDTLYAFIHMDEVVNDSAGLWWGGQWVGDQLFVSLSNRFGLEMAGNYDGNIYAAPDGPYHYLILGEDVTLNNGAETFVPEEYRKCFDLSDSLQTFAASDYARWGISIDSSTGVWNIELAIYHPAISSQAEIGFNIGGSQGHWSHDIGAGDAYAYYTWQPNVPDNPFEVPANLPAAVSDPGGANLINSETWTVLNFVDGTDRLEFGVSTVDPSSITLDAQRNEPAWSTATTANLVSSTGYNFWINYYGREGLSEPEYDEYFVKFLWAMDTLYAFIHMDEVVNDSAGLWWGGQWVGDQLFVSLSNRFGKEMEGNYDGNIYAAPDGPYHYLILGEDVTLNNGAETYIPEEYRGSSCFGDSLKAYNASDYARWAVSVDSSTGVWNLELAIYHPAINSQGQIGFNIGGSQGHWSHDIGAGDAYAYYTWLPNVPDNPFEVPANLPPAVSDPGGANLINSERWAVLNFVNSPTLVEPEDITEFLPTAYGLHQNYPNPFNPTTTIRFDVAQSGVVSLKVYNLLGQLVATLIDSQEMSQGTYQFTWDAKDLGSGMYLYQLESGDIRVSRKMILLK